MAEPENVLRARLHYYCREKFFRAMQNAALEGTKRFAGDSVYRFYYGISLALEGRVQEAIRELDAVQNNRDVLVGSLLAQIYSHRKCRVVDREAVAQLDTQLKESRKQAGERGLYFAGLFLFFTRRYDKAKEYVDRMVRMAPTSAEGRAMKGWLEIMSGKEPPKNVLQFFDSSGSNDPDIIFGKAKCYEKGKNYTLALETLNQAVVLYPNLSPAMIEKMKMQLALHDWDQTLDCINRVLSHSKESIVYF